MSQTARCLGPVVLLVLALTASTARADGQLETRPQSRTPSAVGLASLWNALDDLVRTIRESVAGPEGTGSATAPPPPAGDPDRGLTIDPWG